jgi:hypothetical protein
MASAISKASCVICNKGIGEFECEGCSKTFCNKNITEYRQGSCQQSDKVVFEDDIFQQTTIDDKNQNHLLMIYVSEWEKKSIEKIRQIAQDMREQVSRFDDIHNGEFFDYHIGT